MIYDYRNNKNGSINLLLARNQLNRQSGRKLHSKKKDGSVVILTSKIASGSDEKEKFGNSNQNHSPGSSGGKNGLEYLSTDETEVRHQIQQIEKKI